MLEENINTIKHIAKFYAAYEIVLEGPIAFDELKRKLMKTGMPETSARRYVSEFRCPFCSALLKQDNDGRVSIRLAGMEELIFDFAEWLGMEVVPKEIYDVIITEFNNLANCISDSLDQQK